MSCGEYLFRVNNEHMRATFIYLFLVFLLLTLSRYFAKRIQGSFTAICSSYKSFIKAKEAPEGHLSLSHGAIKKCHDYYFNEIFKLVLF